ncbi:terminase small subunit [Arthrobacter phage BruhMoment]|nr:terminase small subunit [Arthrobacter phage BruhMoment]
MTDWPAVIDGNDPDQTTPLSDIDSSDTKAEAAVTMAIYGASPSEIARTLNYSSPYRARMAVERALASADNAEEDKDKVRKIIDKRLNRLLAAHMSQALDVKNPQQLAHSARVLAIVDRQARLHGVDAPTQIQVSASDQYIEEFIAAVMPSAANDMKVIEAEILEEGEAADGES